MAYPADGWNLQERCTVSLVSFDLFVPARQRERRRITPRVIVQGEEISSDSIWSTVKVCQLLIDVLRDICSGVSNWDISVLSCRNVCLHVSLQSLDVWRCNRVVALIDDLVSVDDEEQVGVLGEGVDGCEDTLQVLLIVGQEKRLVVGTVEREVGSVGIEGKVDACVCKKLHACIVVDGVVDCVDSDGVDAEFLEIGDVACEVGNVDQWICCICCSTGPENISL